MLALWYLDHKALRLLGVSFLFDIKSIGLYISIFHTPYLAVENTNKRSYNEREETNKRLQKKMMYARRFARDSLYRKEDKI